MSPIDLQTISDILALTSRPGQAFWCHVTYRLHRIGSLKRNDTCPMSEYGRQKSSGEVVGEGCALALGTWLLAPAFIYLIYKFYRSVPVRVIATVWTVIWVLLVVMLLSPSGTHDRAAAVDRKPVARETTSGTTGVQERMSGQASHNGSAEPATLSSAAREMEMLWEELKSFRSNPDFHRMGFGIGSPFADWRTRVDRLAERWGRELVSEVGVPPRQLITMANEYMEARGRETEMTRHFSGQLEAAFNPETRDIGEGRVTASTDGCSNIERLLQSMAALDRSEHRRSNALLEQANCVTIARGTTVGVVQQRRTYTFEGGGGVLAFILVRTSHGLLWLPENEVAY